MQQVPTVEADITLLSSDEGGREHPLSLAIPTNYRPHIVIGDPAQRQAVLRADNSLAELYLGVIFLSGPALVQPGGSFQATLGLIYHPNVDYSAVTPGTEFTIREGPHIVGYGRVTKKNSEHFNQ